MDKDIGLESAIYTDSRTVGKDSSHFVFHSTMNGGNMADTKKSSSLEQQRAEDELFCMVEEWLGCKVSRNPKVKMCNDDSVHIEPDFYSEEHGIIGEIFAHV